MKAGSYRRRNTHRCNACIAALPSRQAERARSTREPSGYHMAHNETFLAGHT
ncbi:hypothetical protein B0G84_4262 [Paraburkholderia sp. BL8N3]|jgi:hypothetical protein|nr:hypothetical protein B0G84_4262 [Paraburkholderia sp. BL8N3]